MREFVCFFFFAHAVSRTSTGKLFRMKSKILKQNSVDRLAESSGGTGSAEKDNLSCSPNSFSSPEKAGNVSTTPTFYPTTVNGGNTLTPPSNPQSPGSVSNSSGSANSGNSSMSNSRQGLPRRKVCLIDPRSKWFLSCLTRSHV